LSGGYPTGAGDNHYCSGAALTQQSRFIERVRSKD
jgi:hypothetical protein